MSVYQFILVTVLVVIQVTIQGQSTEVTPVNVEKKSVYRLPKDSQPILYDIKLTPNLTTDKPTFNGEIKIKIKVNKPINVLTLHAKNLTIDRVIKLTNLADTSCVYRAIDNKINVLNDFLTITFNESIPPDEYLLQLKFNGLINDDAQGFYRSSYINKEGKKRWLGFTHFEATEARQAFPCWDEPSFKARFKLTIKHSIEYNSVLSNMPKMSSVIDPHDCTKKITKFRTSPKMSTYLVAFIITDLDHLSSVDDDNVRLWVRKDKFADASVALEIGDKVLQAFGNYIGIQYEDLGIGRMKIVLTPFVYAGMESWGLVRYDEQLTLTNDVTSEEHKDFSIILITHELIHQWFGNLVTPEWWKYLWLKEGFATYFAVVIANQIKPEWLLMDRFGLIYMMPTFPGDSQHHSSPMEIEVDSLEEIIAAFNYNIAYLKAASIIRMISHVLGEEKFKEGLQNYLTNNQYKTVTSDNLYNELSMVADTDSKLFKEILINWVTTPGFPVINVTRNYKCQTATIVQSRLLAKSDIKHQEKYWIPLNYVTEDNLNFNDTKPTLWLGPNDTTVEISNITENKFVIFNKQQFGYYRVNYDEQNWKLISRFLNDSDFNKIHVINRAQLIDDAFNLALVGQLRYKVALGLLRYLKKETHYIPWEATWQSIMYVNEMLTNTSQSQSFKNYLLELSNKLVNEVTFNESPEDDHLTKMKRTSALTWACTLGSQVCLDDATEKLNKWLNNTAENSLSPNLKKYILCAGVQNSDEQTWNRVFQKYLNEKDADILIALTCSFNTKLLNDYLNYIVNEKSEIKDRDGAFKALYAKSPKGVNVVLDYLTNHLNDFVALNGGDNSVVGNHIVALGGKITTEQQRNKLKAFIETNEDKLPKDVTQGLESAENNLNWRTIRAKETRLFFKC